jgi:ribonuclease G
VKDAAGTKGPKLTGIIELSGEHIVFMPFGRYIAVSKKIADPKKQQILRKFGNAVTKQGEGIIFRTSAEECSQEDLLGDIEALRQKYDQLVTQTKQLKKVALLSEMDDFKIEVKRVLDQIKFGEIIIDDLNESKKWQHLYPHLTVHFHQKLENIFSSYDVETDLQKVLKRIVWLANGAYLIVDEAEAATIIDINTGKYEGKQQVEQTVFQTNKLAAVEVARQIRIRNISGIILVDFIDMSKENQDKIEKLMINELRQDNRQTKVIGFTSLGILQLTRKKTVKSLSEVMKTKCSICEGTGFVLSSESIAFQLERELWEYQNKDYELVEIVTTKDVINIFCGEHYKHKDVIEKVLGFKIIFIEAYFPMPQYNIKYFGERKKKS